MELKQFESMILFAQGCEYSSLNYVDYEDVQSADIICFDESLLLLHGKSNDYGEIHYATNVISELLNRIGTNDLKGLIKFVPYAYIELFRQHGFETHCIFQDYLLKDLKQLTQHLNRDYDTEFASLKEAKRISEVSKACAGQSRGFFGETEAWVSDWLTENEIIIKRVDDVLVGFCCVSIYAEGTTLWIRELAVHPDFQGKGYGKALLEMGLKYGLSKGAEKSFLAVDVENRNAIQLYEHFGYEAKKNDIEVQMIRR